MDYDPNELQVVSDTDAYRDALADCRARAVQASCDGVRVPAKIINDRYAEFYGSDKGGNNDKYGRWLTNCTFARITIDGVVYNSSEHYYQCAKFDVRDEDVAAWCATRRTLPAERIAENRVVRQYMMTLTPYAVAKYGQQNRDVPIRVDWNEIRDSVMWRALVAKFTQNATHAEALKGTGARVLIERAPTDAYWAVNNAGRGENRLGLMLTTLRSMLE